MDMIWIENIFKKKQAKPFVKIFCEKYLKGCAKVRRRSPLCVFFCVRFIITSFVSFFLFPSASVISMVSHVTFLTNVFREREKKKKKYFSKQYHYLPFYSKPCIFTYIYQWCVFVIKQKIAVKASLCYIILWLFSKNCEDLHILYTEVLSLNAKD